MKYIIIVPDGMFDQPVEELGNKTPLEVAHKTNMLHLASRGMTGLVQTIPTGMKPGSDIGNLALLGYDPKKNYTGRAPLEAANLNIMLDEDEVAFRCNLVTMEDHKMADYSAGHISTKEAMFIIASLNEHMASEEVQFYAGKSYRHLMVLKTRQVKKILDIKCTPPHDISGKDIKPYLPQGPDAVLILKYMERAREILKDHNVNRVRIDLKENPANMIWLWGQGVKPALPNFEEKFGVKGSIISAVDLVNGIGRLAGLEIINVPGATGYYDTDYLAKAQYALGSLKQKDFVFIHIEAPDEAGHNGDAKAKVAAIENIDRLILGTVLNHFNLEDDVRILVLPDHPTPVKLRTHTGDPVGFIMAGKGIAPDGSTKYDESSTKTQGLKFKSGEELINYFFKHNINA